MHQCFFLVSPIPYAIIWSSHREWIKFVHRGRQNRKTMSTSFNATSWMWSGMPTYRGNSHVQVQLLVVTEASANSSFDNLLIIWLRKQQY